MIYTHVATERWRFFRNPLEELNLPLQNNEKTYHLNAALNAIHTEPAMPDTALNCTRLKIITKGKIDAAETPAKQVVDVATTPSRLLERLSRLLAKLMRSSAPAK